MKIENCTRLALVGAVTATLIGTSFPAFGSELLLNNAFDQGSNNWHVTSAATNDLFATAGQVSLNVPGYTGNVINQDVDMIGASNAYVWAGLTLTRNASTPGATVAAYLYYTDDGGATNRLLLLRPDNESITNETLVTTNFTLPGNARRIVRLGVDKEADGNFDLLAASLDVTPSSPAPYLYLLKPNDGDSFGPGTNIDLIAQVQASDSFVSEVSFRVNGKTIGIGQRDLLHGEWEFPPGDHMSIMSGFHEMIDYRAASGTFFMMDGIYPTPNHFAGVFATWQGDAMVSGNVTVDFSFTSSGHLNALIQGDAPLGNRNLTDGTSSGQSTMYTLTWTNVPAGLYGITAAAVYGAGDTAMASPVNISVSDIVQPPTLHIRLDKSASVELWWVSSNSGFVPMSTTDLRNPNWQSVGASPQMIDGIWSVKVSIGNTPLFFRLQK